LALHCLPRAHILRDPRPEETVTLTGAHVDTPAGSSEATTGSAYSQRLVRLQTRWWKRTLSVQTPYRWNLRRLQLGFSLDLGCGIGRNLANLDGQGVGVDHNADSVRIAVTRGLTAYTPEAFAHSVFAHPGVFDSLLMAHVVEHLTHAGAVNLLHDYLPFVRDGGKVVLIAPQERGFRSDSTHLRFVNFGALEAIAREAGLGVERRYSFPFPRQFGRLFTYNEFVLVATIHRVSELP
jgi:SAM-dependent methyltransferase